MAKMKKKDLGKGIRALLSGVEDKDTGTQKKIVKELSSTVAMVPIKFIEANPFQPRNEFSSSELEELTESIKIHGIIQPITLRRLSDDAYQIISGERRWRASQKAGLEEIPAYIRVANDQAMLEMALIENIQRQDLNPIEIAISLNRLMDECQLTHEGLSERVSKQRSTVTNYLRLLKLPPQVQQSVRNQKISMGHARSIAGLKKVDQQLQLLNDILKKSLSVRATEEWVRKFEKGKGSKKSVSSSTKKEQGNQVKMLEDKLLQRFGTKVNIREKNTGHGQIVIHFDDREHLNQLLEYLKVI
ncbi:MAG: ParB/RepB/Spo0J family partition protein [Saprospirales bacterium]|nr:MAG: ParB/RepB/Spo0J family partition protein [Saprospirales bacterium]